MAQFDALLAILEPHIKKTANFCELSVQGSIYAVDEWMNLTIAILDFVVHLYSGYELLKHLSKCLPRMRRCKKKKKKSNQIQKIMTDENFRGSV